MKEFFKDYITWICAIPLGIILTGIVVLAAKGGN